MNITEWILILAIAYFLLMFVVIRFFAPFYGFKQYTVPTDLPLKIKQAILELEAKSHDQMSYLQAVYGFVTDKTINQWKHTRFKTLANINRGFLSELEEIWETDGFIYCTAINFVANVLISNSKFFKAQDVKVRHVFLNFVLHQYLQVQVGDKWINFDPSGSGIRGGSLGTYASFFG